MKKYKHSQLDVENIKLHSEISSAFLEFENNHFIHGSKILVIDKRLIFQLKSHKEKRANLLWKSSIP